jgi:hypothetical protein
VREQPRHSAIEEYAGPLSPRPAQGTKPASEPKASCGITKVTVTKPLPDFGSMLPAPSALTVLVDCLGFGDSQLPAQRLDNFGRYRHRIFQKGSQETHRRQLQGEPQPVVIASSAQGQGLVVFAEMEKARQFIRRGGSGVAAIAFLLGGSKKADGHRRDRR